MTAYEKRKKKTTKDFIQFLNNMSRFLQKNTKERIDQKSVQSQKGKEMNQICK